MFTSSIIYSKISCIDALVASWSGSSKANAGKVNFDSTPRLHPHSHPQIQTTTLASSASSQYFSHLPNRTQSSKRPPGPAKEREREKFITRQPTTGEKDDYDSENSWISEGLPGSSRRKSRGEGRGKGGRGREKASASEVEVGVDGAKSGIKVERRCVPECSTEDFAESVIEITVIGIVVIVIGHRSARAYSGMPVCNYDILACISLLVVNINAR